MKKTIVNLNIDRNSITDEYRIQIIEFLEKELNNDELLIFWNSLENRIYTIDINDKIN